ncbi:MAG: GAF domain-containing protein, partial [Chloroflexota bacterium]
ISGRQILGTLNMGSVQVDTYQERDKQLAQQLASLIAAALESRRLFEQTRQTLAETETLYKINQQLNQSEDLQSLIKAVAEGIDLPAVNRVVLNLFEQDRDRNMEAMQIAATWYSGQGPKPTPVGTRYQRETFTSLKVLLTQEPLFIENTLTDPRIDSGMQEILERIEIMSAILLPLWAGGRQLGVLAFQSDIPYSYSEYEHRSLLAIAQQVAVAIDNQRLLSETQATLAELEAVQSRYTVQAWEVYRAKAKQKGFKKIDDTIVPIAEDQLNIEAQNAILHNKTVVKSGNELDSSSDEISSSPNIMVPLTIRNEIIGILGVEDPDNNRRWTTEEIELVEAIVEQMAQTAENLRLFDETQERASRERTIRQITEQMRSVTSLDDLVKTTAKALGQQLSAGHAVIELGTIPENDAHQKIDKSKSSSTQSIQETEGLS